MLLPSFSPPLSFQQDSSYWLLLVQRQYFSPFLKTSSITVFFRIFILLTSVSSITVPLRPQFRVKGKRQARWTWLDAYNSSTFTRITYTPRHTPMKKTPKLTSRRTYRYTCKISQNSREPAITGYLRSINAIDSTCHLIER